MSVWCHICGEHSHACASSVFSSSLVFYFHPVALRLSSTVTMARRLVVCSGGRRAGLRGLRQLLRGGARPGRAGGLPDRLAPSAHHRGRNFHSAPAITVHPQRRYGMRWRTRSGRRVRLPDRPLHGEYSSPAGRGAQGAARDGSGLPRESPSNQMDLPAGPARSGWAPLGLGLGLGGPGGSGGPIGIIIRQSASTMTPAELFRAPAGTAMLLGPPSGLGKPRGLQACIWRREGRGRGCVSGDGFMGTRNREGEGCSLICRRASRRCCCSSGCVSR